MQLYKHIIKVVEIQAKRKTCTHNDLRYYYSLKQENRIEFELVYQVDIRLILD